MRKLRLSKYSKYIAVISSHNRKNFFVLMLVTLLSAGMQSAGIVMMLPFMNIVLEPDTVRTSLWMRQAYEFLRFPDTESFIIFFGVILLLLIIIGNFITAYSVWLKLKLVWDINHEISAQLLKKYLSLPYSYFLNHNSAGMGKNVLDEVTNLTGNFMIPVVTIITRGVMSVAIVGVLLFTNFWGTVITFSAVGGGYLLIFHYYRRKLTITGRLRMELNTLRYKTVNEAFGGIKDLKVLNREPYYLEMFTNHSQQFVSLQAWNAIVGQIPRYFIEVVAFGGVVALTLVLLITHGNSSEAIPLLSLYAFAAYRLMPAVQEIFQALTKMQFSVAVFERLCRDLTDSPDGSSTIYNFGTDKRRDAVGFNHGIKLNNVSFKYEGATNNTLDQVNIDIPRNATVAIVGSTGSGKTTLIDILLGLLIPQSGQILIDGQALTIDQISQWREKIGYIPQSIYLSDDTIRRNIAFGVPDDQINQGKIENAAKIANIHEFIVAKLDDSYSTVIGERGVRLSGGQRQRIGIARALYHNPEILIMDEATSALDTLTEAAVIEAMENLSKIKTLIVVAHRLSTIRNADMIYVMENGSVHAFGTYDCLVTENDYFQKMTGTSNNFNTAGKE